MARDLTASAITQLTASRCFPIVFCELKFSSGTSRLWSGIGDLSWDGHTWSGTGRLASVSAMPEGSDVAAEGLTLTLDGIPTTYVQQVLTECRQGYPVKIWLGFMDTSGSIVADPYQSFSGRMDVPTINESAETCSVSLTVESRLIDLQRPRERRYTHEDQQLDYPGDTGFENVAALQNLNIVWGKAGNGAPVHHGPSNQVARDYYLDR
jgi:hypothetical protein